jgi:transposase
VVLNHALKIACERPDTAGRSLSLWDCNEIAQKLVHDGIVQSISRESVRRMLLRQRIRPWTYKMWLSPKVARDEAFAACVQQICELYTRPLAFFEMVLCVDEMTSLQPRPRKAATLPSKAGMRTRLEHEYSRCGALNLFSALDTRSGRVFARTAERKRQSEFIAFLEQLHEEIPAYVSHIHLVLDNVPMHKGKEVRAWLAKHPRFILHHPPVHCSWMNQVEQFFSIVQRKRLRFADFASKAALSERLLAFITQWNETAHAFRWSTQSFDKILDKCEQALLGKQELRLAA